MAIFGAIGSEFASDEPDDFTTGTPSYAVLGVGNLTLLGQISSRGPVSFTLDNVLGGLLIIGHWQRGWCIVQYGQSVTNQILCGTLEAGVTCVFDPGNNTVTISTENYPYTAIFKVV